MNRRRCGRIGVVGPGTAQSAGDMILGKAPVLQKTHLPGAVRPVFRDAGPEFAATNVCRQQHPVRCGFERCGHGFGRQASLTQGMAHALRALPPPGEHAHQSSRRSAHRRAGALPAARRQWRRRWRRRSPCGPGLQWLRRWSIRAAPRAEAPRRGPLGICRAVFIDTPPRTLAASAPAQLSFSFSCSAAFLTGRSLVRIWPSMSRAISGCSLRKLRVLSLPWPMRSPL